MPSLARVPLLSHLLHRIRAHMDTSKLEQAVDRLTRASETLSGKIDAQTRELADLRSRVSNPTPPAPPADDTAGQSAIDGAVARLNDAADSLDRANSSIDGASATSSGTANASSTPGAGSPAGSPTTGTAGSAGTAAPSALGVTEGSGGATAPGTGLPLSPLTGTVPAAGDVNAPGTGPFGHLNPTA